ncbi:MAG: hypothetical protein ACYTE0_07955 [Planctomycetota bacterium]|jgi:hypothetical protein
MTNEIESLGDFNTQWIFAQYEAGKPVSAIAAEMKVSESAVYARMRMRPKTYEELKKVREELYCRRLRRVRGLADELALDYLERQYAKRQKAKSEKAIEKIDEQIEKVLKIGKLFADRVQLAEGKATANLGNANGLPFKIIVTRLPEGKTPDDLSEQDLLTTEDTE